MLLPEPFFLGSHCIHTYAWHVPISVFPKPPSIHKHACINQCPPSLGFPTFAYTFSLHSHSCTHQCHPFPASLYLHTLLPRPPCRLTLHCPVPQFTCGLPQSQHHCHWEILHITGLYFLTLFFKTYIPFLPQAMCPHLMIPQKATGLPQVSWEWECCLENSRSRSPIFMVQFSKLCAPFLLQIVCSFLRDLEKTRAFPKDHKNGMCSLEKEWDLWLENSMR